MLLRVHLEQPEKMSSDLEFTEFITGRYSNVADRLAELWGLKHTKHQF